jgi:uncharacterized protein (TIGR02996 family)
MSLEDPDWITFRGRHRMLLSFPLDAYLRKLAARPDFGFEGAQHRGYIASWEVRPDDTLWLTGLKTQPDGPNSDLGIALVFPKGGPVPATWVDQPLQTQEPKDRRYSPIGYGTTSSRETHLSVRAGRVVMVEEVDGKSGRRIGGELTHHLEGLFGTEESPFLRACFAAPDDAAPRLVYADWLDERHDPRANVVRLAERFRHLDRESARRERTDFREQLGPCDWLWRRLLGFDHLVTDLILVVE